jgi:hypothetical protein
MLIPFNILATLGSYLFLTGSVDISRFKQQHVLVGFIGFVVLSLGFTVVKYAVVLGQELSRGGVWDSLWIVVKISGFLALGLGLLTWEASE